MTTNRFITITVNEGTTDQPNPIWSLDVVFEPEERLPWAAIDAGSGNRSTRAVTLNLLLQTLLSEITSEVSSEAFGKRR